MKYHALVGVVARIAGLATLFTCGLLTSAAAAPRGQGDASINSQSNDGPVRLARFKSVRGDVSWRPDDQSEWSQAVSNLPLRQGAQISVANGSRAEVQFDDGSHLWMGSGAVVTLRSLYSDSEGEFTELTLHNGTVGLGLRNDRSVYQVDTSFLAVDSAGPARFRIDSKYGVQVRDRQGRITVKGDQGKATLNPGDYLSVRSDRDSYHVTSAPAPDSFDNWTSDSYLHETRYWRSPDRNYVPSDVAIVSDDLDDYGTWRTDPKYGHVWCPRETDADWRPYHSGHWVWVAPFGWTWVASEPWGWAPYHYGSWIHESDSWAWVPGPAQQYWTPAAVDFCDSNGNIAWCPLAPTEVHYPPTLSIGFQGGDWSAFFSIGGAAVYYPTQYGYAVPRPWSSGYVNNTTYVNNVTNINNYYGGALANHNSYVGNQGYVPYNARYAAGASVVQAAAFGTAGVYRAVPRGANQVFTHGRFVGAPTGSFAAVAGPPRARLTPIALAPTRRLRRSNPVPQAVLARPVYQAAGRLGNRNTVQQARALSAAAGVAVGAGAAAHLAAHRSPTPMRSTATPVRGARPATSHAAMPVSPAQRAAMQARAALGRPTGARRNVSALRPTAPQHITGSAPRPTRPIQATPAQRAANQARAAIGIRPRTGTGAAPNRTAPRQVTHAPNAPQQARAARRPVPVSRPIQHRAPQAQRAATPIRRQTAPRIQRSVTQVQPNRQPQVRRSAAPPPQAHRAVHRTAPVQHAAPQVQHYAPPVRRQAPQIQRAAAQPPRPRQSAPVQQMRPPAQRSAPPVQRPAPPQNRPPVQRSAPPPPQNRQPARPAEPRDRSNRGG